MNLKFFFHALTNVWAVGEILIALINNWPGSRQVTRPRNADYSLGCDYCIAQDRRLDAQIFPGRHAGEL